MSKTETGTWEEEQAQAHQDGWALRILTCPRLACRRLKRCTRFSSCPGRKTYPFTPAAIAAQMKWLDCYLERLEPLDDAELAKAFEAAHEAAARQRKLAFERARETLGIERKRRGGG